LTLTGGSLSLSLSLKKVSAVRIAIPASPSKIGVSPKLLATGAGTNGAASTGTIGGASTTGRTHPPAGACAVAAALAAVVAAEPHKAVAEACEPNMLSATIGLIGRGKADAEDADASAGLASNVTATLNVVTILKTLTNIMHS